MEALARLQKQDEQFCRRLRIAIETGREFLPDDGLHRAMYKSPYSELLPAGLIPPI